MIDNYRLLARYNQWMNERLYQACDGLSEAERRLDRGAFFGSIHGTLNHLMWGDLLWLRRFATADPARCAALAADLLELPQDALFATIVHEDWNALGARRQRLDAAIVAWTQAMPPEYPQEIFRYSNTKGVQREHPVWIALTHLFNHQTHHRGQLTTLLMQAGVDPGVTDLIALATMAP